MLVLSALRQDLSKHFLDILCWKGKHQSQVTFDAFMLEKRTCLKNINHSINNLSLRMAILKKDLLDLKRARNSKKDSPISFLAFFFFLAFHRFVAPLVVILRWKFVRDVLSTRNFEKERLTLQERKSQVVTSQPNPPPAVRLFLSDFFCVSPRAPSFFLYLFLFRSLLRLTHFFLLLEKDGSDENRFQTESSGGGGGGGWFWIGVPAINEPAFSTLTQIWLGKVLFQLSSWLHWRR